MTEPNKHDHISGRPRNYISRKWFHRGRHRVGKQVSDIAKRINHEYFGEYDPDGPAWQMTSDKQYYMLQAPIAISPEPGIETITVDLPCPHERRKITHVTEDVYSNGMFGLPASNMPITVDLYSKTICTDCGKELFLDSETGIIVCDGGWHADAGN